MDIKSYIKYLYIFYYILVFSLGLRAHHINNKKIGDCEGFIKKPIIFRGG